LKPIEKEYLKVVSVIGFYGMLRFDDFKESEIDGYHLIIFLDCYNGKLDLKKILRVVLLG
jgi:hypothetical protein